MDSVNAFILPRLYDHPASHRLMARILWAMGLLFLMLVVVPTHAFANENISITVAEDIEVDINVFPAEDKTVLLWLACNEGSEGAETRAAKKLVEQGIEIWFPDLLSAHFLPQAPSSIYTIPGEEIAKIIDRVFETHPDSAIYLVAGGRATAPLLRGAVAWEQHHANSRTLAGAILLYPRLNLRDIEPGKEPVYIEAVGQAKLPIVILEGERTPNRWGLPHLTDKLKQGTPFVHSDLIPKVRGYFYTRPNKTADESAMMEKLHELIATHLKDFDK